MRTDSELAPAELNEAQAVAKDILASLCNENLSRDDIHGEMLINQNLGIGSLKFIRLILTIETTLGKKIFNVQNIADIKTVNDLYAVLSTK